MTNKDILFQKINSVQNCLKRIHDTVLNDPKKLDSLDAQDIVTLNLQRAVQLIIDIGSHVIAVKKLGIPESLKDIFIILEKNKFLDASISAKMQKMVGFRNVALYDYQAVDPAILKNVVFHHLSDLEVFYSQILHSI